MAGIGAGGVALIERWSHYRVDCFTVAGIGAGGVALIERWSHYRVDCFTVAGNRCCWGHGHGGVLLIER